MESFAEYTDRWENEVAGAGKARVARCLTRLLCKGPCFVTSMHAGRGCIALYHILTGPASFRGHLRAFGKCTDVVASSKRRLNLDSVRLIV